MLVKAGHDAKIRKTGVQMGFEMTQIGIPAIHSDAIAEPYSRTHKIYSGGALLAKRMTPCVLTYFLV